MNTARKQLLNSTVIYFIGSALSQLVSLFLMRFITGKIAADEYGYYNLIVTIDNLITPIFTLQIGDALFRYFIKADSLIEKKRYYTPAMFIVYGGGVVMAGGVLLINFCFYRVQHLLLVIAYILSTNLFNVYLKILRSMGKNKEFAAFGLIKTALYLVLQMVFLFVFNMGGECLFLSITISTLAVVLAIELFLKPYRYFSVKELKMDALKKMLRFSAPLIPNTMLWWLCSSINSLIVSTRLGLDINGIYSVATKFSNILVMVTQVFSTAWQESVIKEYDQPNFKKYQTETFNMYAVLVFSGVVALVPLINLAIPHMIDPAYYSSIQYVPWLLLATALSTISGYVAQIITAQERTKSVMYTSVVGGAVNLLVVLLLVDRCGLWAAVCGTLFSNGTLVAIRLYLTRREFTRDIAFVKLGVLMLLFAINLVAYFMGNMLVNAILLAIAIAAAILCNMELIKDFLQIFTSKFKRKTADE